MTERMRAAEENLTKICSDRIKGQVAIPRKLKVVHENNRKVQVNDILIHPLAEAAKDSERDKWKYKFLRIICNPAFDRPDSGRILVRNLATGNITEHYSILFGVGFKVI